jgi:soluble lytic murein transglycosylase
MKSKKSTSKINSFASLFTLSALFISSQASNVDAATNKQVHNRITHAKELLGHRYQRSSVRKTERTDNISVFITNSVRNLLPKSHKGSASVIAASILKESEKFRFDPIFLMAVIQNESSFNPRMKGSVGEIGLMQVKPETAEWIAKTYKISYNGAESLYQPETNVRIGAAYLAKLRDQFSSNSTLYLTAYNAGAGKVRQMVSNKIAPKIYATAVMKRYFAIYSALGSEKGSQAERANLVLAHVKNITKIAKN